MKRLKWLGLIVFALIVVYFIGPRPESPKYGAELPKVPASPEEIQSYVSRQESRQDLKPDNEARIVWFNDSAHSVTDYSVVYIHGFSASQEEGDPVHASFARTFGCNLYLSRLEDHGLKAVEPLLDVTADRLWNSSKEALAIGKVIGKRVILLATSTGATLALKLASQYPEIAGLILLSPNICINDPNAWVLNNHWGLQIARLVKGKYNVSRDTSVMHARYWNASYRMEAAVQLQELLETTMKESTFTKIKQPTLVLYYYKDEDHQDDVVKVSGIKRMFQQLGTPDSLKQQLAIPNAGDHVIGSSIKSKDVASVIKACENFATEVLRLKHSFQAGDTERREGN